MPSLRSFPYLRVASALVVLVCAITLVSPLSIRQISVPGELTFDALTFYGVTIGAYGLLPFVRRGDVAIVAMWVVLGVGVAPCFVGREISAARMFADMAGVLMAAGPIFVARFRQVAQGDMRPYGRRETDAVAVQASNSSHAREGRDAEGVGLAQAL